MATLPGLVIKIGANTKDAIDGLNKVNRAMGQSASTATRVSTTWRKVGPSLGIAAAAAAALAVKLGTDAVQAAVEEERSVSRLNKTLDNLNFGGASDKVAEFIDNLQFSANVADTDLRESYASLLRSTRSVTTAQDALSLSLDISAGTGKDLAQVSTALSRAYSGNYTGLSRLNAGLSKTLIKSGDMVAITKQLKDVYGGQSQAQADTLYGSIKGVEIAYNELLEAFGQGLVGTGSGDAKELQNVEQQLRDMQPQAQRVGEDIRSIGLGALTTWDRLSAMNDVLDQGDWAGFWDMMKAGATGDDRAFANVVNRLNSVGDEFSMVAIRAYQTKTAWSDYTTAAEATTKATDDQTASIKRLQSALSGLDKNRSVLRQRFDLQQLLAQGPNKTGKKVTLADRKEFAFGIADQSSQLASDLLGQRKRGAARNALQSARQTIRGLNLPGAFESDLLSTLRTPSALRPGNQVRPGTPQSGAAVAAVNYNFYGGIQVDSNQAARQAAKEAKRLAALSGSRYAGMAETGRGY